MEYKIKKQGVERIVRGKILDGCKHALAQHPNFPELFILFFQDFTKLTVGMENGHLVFTYEDRIWDEDKQGV